MPIRVDGHCEPGFEDVQESFRRNFKEKWELGGAAFTAYYKGKKVIDIWGGFSDKSCKRPWREDTMTTIFSCTKSLTAICFAILVDRGHCRYEDKVADHWPEFEINGKESITIDMVLGHRAGLPFLDQILALEELTNLELLSQIIEKQTPIYEPGAKTAYHALTYGWIADQIFRRIDTSNRTIGQFFREEIAERHHVDVHMGECWSEEARVARITDFNRKLCVREFLYDRAIGKMAQFFYKPGGYFRKALKNMNVFGDTFCMFNNFELRAVGQPAVNAVGTARGLAQCHQLLLDGALISPKLLHDLSAPRVKSEFDHTLGERQIKSHGFMYTKSAQESWQFGHSGVGGQIVKVDLEGELVFAYLTNAMKAGTGEHVFTCNRLSRKLYCCIRNLKSIENELMIK